MPSTLPHWIHRIGLSYPDLIGFGEDLRLQGNSLLALHRDAAGTALGWERIAPGRDGTLRYGYPSGLHKGCVRSWHLDPVPARLLLACGPLPALCARALDGARRDTIYVGLAGCWTAASAETTANLIEAGVREVVLAFGANQTGERSLAAATAFFRGSGLGGQRMTRRTPAAGSWPAALRRMRCDSSEEVAA
ncbi:hypothetical protein [Siccirubricoccus sp. G192]|uniref:hypothetical protein n=1 Tax=Siccirubricoccus sp. G192 TaxID=2849651 RepID=UPI001C2C8E46|nr:hypothetical protein [Siccirubricoccus sp. G192]MBV1798722.1 hypothetical protein [Siccirubricoccus sp. G192]